MKQVNDIRDKTERQHHIQTEQLLLIRESIELNTRSHADLNNKINERLSKISEFKTFVGKQFDNLQLSERFLEMSDVAMLMLTEHERLSTQILQNLENTLNGRMSQLIPAQTSKDDIAMISIYLNENQILPIEPLAEDILHIYRFTTVRAALVEITMFIELTIPVVERDRYTLYKTIPVPVKTPENTIITTTKSQFFILSDDMSEYIPLTADEYKNAIMNK